MSTGVKILVWTLVILGVLALLVFVFVIPWGKKVWDKITFSQPRLEALDLQGLSLADLANIAFTGQTKEVTAVLGMDIKNENNFSIPFSNLRAQLFYQDVLIAETTDNRSYTVPANGSLAFSNPVKIILNNAGGQLLIEKASGRQPIIDYKINANVFGIPLPSIKNKMPW